MKLIETDVNTGVVTMQDNQSN